MAVLTSRNLPISCPLLATHAPHAVLLPAAVAPINHAVFAAPFPLAAAALAALHHQSSPAPTFKIQAP